MTYSLGSLVPLSITVRNAAGTPTATTPVVVTITLPDGTTATPAVSTSSTGVYFVDYAAPQAGRYEAFWTTSGTIVSSFGPDAFEVTAATRAPLVGLAEIKEHLGLSAVTATDTQILAMLADVTDAVESAVGRPLRRTTLVESFSGEFRQALRLRSIPCPCTVCAPFRVLTISSLTEDGASLVQGVDYVLSSLSGVLTRGTVPGFATWSGWADQNVTATYVTGYRGTPRWARLAVLRAMENIWTRSQQRPHPGFGQAPDSDFGAQTSYGMFVLPYPVQALIEPHIAPGF